MLQFRQNDVVLVAEPERARFLVPGAGTLEVVLEVTAADIDESAGTLAEVVAALCDAAGADGALDRLILVAAPAMRGVLLSAMSDRTLAAIGLAAGDPAEAMALTGPDDRHLWGDPAQATGSRDMASRSDSRPRLSRDITVPTGRPRSRATSP